MKRTRILFLNLLCQLLVFVSVVTTFAASHSWLGGSGAFWTVAANWTNGTPSSGDDLYFVSGGLNDRSNYNNFPTDFAFGRITISEGNQVGYVLAGDEITLNNGILASGTLLSVQPQIDFYIIAGANQTWTSSRSLAINNTLNLDGHVITVNNSGGVTFNGTVTDTAALFNTAYGNIDKQNSGLLFFTSNAQLLGYGATLVNTEAGTLRFDGYATNRGGSINVPSIKATSTTVTGTGKIDSMQLTGTLIPGDSAPGILQCDNLQFSGTLVIAINGTNVGTDYSQLASQNVIFGTKFAQCYPDASPVSLSVQFGYTPQVGDTFQIMTGAQSGAKFFDGFWGNCFLQTNGFGYGIAYDANGVSLTTVRAPDSPFLVWAGATNAQNTSISDVNNWVNQTVVTNNSRLQFTPYQYQDQASACGGGAVFGVVDNDVLGRTMASILFTGTNYWITGERLAVTEGITNRCSGTNKFSCDLNAPPGLTLVVDTGSVLQLDGALNATNLVHKIGGGELLYTGTVSNSLAGDLYLDTGSARIDGSILNGTFELHAQGTLTGTGTVSGLHTYGGTMSPGPGTGVMHLVNNFVMDFGTTLQIELNTPTVGSGHDALEVSGTGSISLLDGHLVLLPTNNIPLGTQFTIIVNDTTNTVAGTFSGLPEGAAFMAGGQYFSITYKGGDGNDVVVTRANPPAKFNMVSQVSSNAVRLVGSAGTNLNYTIQATTDLATQNWVNIATVPADGTGYFTFTDTNLFLYPQRFFRALAP